MVESRALPDGVRVARQVEAVLTAPAVRALHLDLAQVHDPAREGVHARARVQVRVHVRVIARDRVQLIEPVPVGRVDLRRVRIGHVLIGRDRAVRRAVAPAREQTIGPPVVRPLKTAGQKARRLRPPARGEGLLVVVQVPQPDAASLAHREHGATQSRQRHRSDVPTRLVEPHLEQFPMRPPTLSAALRTMLVPLKMRH